MDLVCGEHHVYIYIYSLLHASPSIRKHGSSSVLIIIFNKKI
jgi:hypothetical protein